MTHRPAIHSNNNNHDQIIVPHMSAAVAITMRAIALLGLVCMRRRRCRGGEAPSTEITDEERRAYDAAVMDEMTWRD